MTIFEAILQGFLQGFTEFLPVSSSGHLSLFQHFFGISGENAENNLATFITLTAHLGTLIAVFVAFRKKIKELIFEAFSMIKDIFTGKFSFKNMNAKRRMLWLMVVSILPLFGFVIFKDFFSSLGSDSTIFIEGLGFLYTSALIFISCSGKFISGEKTTADLPFSSAFFIGIFQGIALIPGVSRSGSTISAALISKMKREEAVEYSFILGIPVILAGTLVEFLDIGGSTFDFAIILPLIICFITAAIVGYFAIILIKMLVLSDKYILFGYYTAILGVLVLAAATYEMISGNVLVIK